MTNRFLLFIFLLIPFLAKSQTVVDIVVNSPDHNTLEEAVIAAELVDALSGEGPFTLFAPTDDAFANVDSAALAALLADPTGALSDVLQYHVVADSVPAENLSDGDVITMLQGDDAIVSINGAVVMINNAMVTVTNIPATNGIVHVIDAVLLPPSNTIVDIVVNSDIHNTLETAVVAAGLVETLSGEGPFTLFAPTDEAFEAVDPAVLQALLDDPMGALTDVLTYHVLGQEVPSSALNDGDVVATVNGKDVTVTINADGVFINDAQVTIADIPADNGIVHVIDAVLIPPSNTIVDIVVNSDVHNTLETAVIAAGLVETLSGEGPFTLFAPTDVAFEAVDPAVLQALLDDPMGALTDVLTYHVLGQEVPSSALNDGDVVATVNGKDITVTINADGVFINDAQVTIADIPADNGIVHVIDAVLIPPSNTIVDIVVNSDVHNTLETAVIAAGLVETLSGEGPFTLFAPTDEAFEAVDPAVLQALLDDPMGALTDVLTYHVLGQEVPSSALNDGDVVATLNGKDVTVTINADGVFINDAEVIIADIPADNGIVHVIDAVLIPPSNTIVDIVVNSDVHNTLETAVIAAGLVETLSGEGPFTLFAPTDEAFEALDPVVLQALLDDPMGALTEVLTYHVLGQEVPSSALNDGDVVATVNGKDVTVTINADGVFINDAQVIIADIPADNGIVHVIDAVLIPPTTIVDIVVNSDVHNTLETAVIAAGLVETLSGEGPFTLFAPTDAAFDALEPGVLQGLLDDPMGALTDVLTYHVLGQEVPSSALNDGDIVATVNGKDVTVTINADGVFINDAQVIIADIPASNGIVHVIDAVLIPPTNTVFDIIANSDIHNTLETLIIDAELQETLSGDGPFTVFAPTDEAFTNAPADIIAELLADPTGKLQSVLLHHVVGSEELAGDLSDGQSLTTVFNQDVTITFDGGNVFVDDIQIILTDLIGDNGVVHVINGVLLPTGVLRTGFIEAGDLNIYPNPAQDYIIVDLGSDFDRSNSIQIMNQLGQTVKMQEIEGQYQMINMEDLVTGNYFLRIVSANNASIPVKISKI